jgi:prepilin-type N-terminal cleavage/methylation domain-containing protein/prepilin-type processing-associated H-X9-DG protein
MPIRCLHNGRRAAFVALRATSKAFTLLELLVVVAVIAVLAGFLMPELATARGRAWKATCLSNLSQIARAQLLYIDDWDGRFPHWYFPAPPRPEPYGSFTFWTEFLRPYLKSDRVLHCRAADWIWAMPEEEKLAEYVLSTWARGGAGTRSNPYWNWPGTAHTLATIRRPSETIGVIDGFTTGGWTSVDLVRHDRGSQVAFVDGHVRWLKHGEFWTVDQEGKHWYLRYVSADR